MKKAICILSGGVDSTTLVYKLIKEGFKVEAITFFYGQKHDKEILSSMDTCSKLGILQEIVDISSVFKGIGGSALTDGTPIPHGHYEEESMKSTVVPNRNSILLNIAMAYAISKDIQIVAYGAHAGDHAIYPDCRPEFLEKIKELAKVVDYKPIDIFAPFINKSKSEIVKQGIDLKVDYSLTWTCYEGKKLACGKCGSCVERLEAFKDNKIKDPIEYK